MEERRPPLAASAQSGLVVAGDQSLLAPVGIRDAIRNEVRLEVGADRRGVRPLERLGLLARGTPVLPEAERAAARAKRAPSLRDIIVGPPRQIRETRGRERRRFRLFRRRGAHRARWTGPTRRTSGNRRRRNRTAREQGERDRVR